MACGTCNRAVNPEFAIIAPTLNRKLTHIKTRPGSYPYAHGMQAAASSSDLAAAAPWSRGALALGLPDAAEQDALALLDRRDEYLCFSRLAEPQASAAPAGVSPPAASEASDAVQTEWLESHMAVQGMHCAACSLTLEHALQSVPGVRLVRVSAASQRVSLVWSSAQTRPSEWMAKARTKGYRLLPAADALADQRSQHEARLMLWRWLVAGFCMMQVMMYAVPAYVAAPGDISPDIERLLRWASWVLSLPVVFFSCGPFFSNAWRDLRQRTISMDLPVSLGIAITFIASSAATFEPNGWWGAEVYFDSLTMFVFFLLTGRWLEQRLRVRTAGALDALMQRLPDSIERQTEEGDFERVAVRRLQLGDLVRVLPGETFPADGCIEAGDTFADEALLTGESRPVARARGARVLAGSHNLSSMVLVRVEHIGASTRYAEIVAMMASASVDKPRLAMLADQVAKPFLWVVLAAAGLAAVYWWPSDPARALVAAIAVLVVTCPCALSLATPAAMLSSAGWLARQGILVRRLQALESLAGIDTVIFDKTGTLTQARRSLAQAHTRPGISPAVALQMAHALAQHSLHPISRALVAAGGQVAHGHGDQPNEALAAFGLQEFSGQGVQGELHAPPAGVQGVLRLGSARFCGVPADLALADVSTEAAVEAGTMQVHLADGLGWLATFALHETLRADAAPAVHQLQQAGLEVRILSGDRMASVQRVAGQLAIDQAQGDCTPQSKLAYVQALQQQGRKVLMVGDGLNDGPVLASAHVSVALGNAVPLAQAQSDFVMPGAQLLMLPSMLTQARQTMRIVRQNLAWAAGYNAVGVPLAVMGWLPPWLAGLGMALSSLLVIANAARLSTDKRGAQAATAVSPSPSAISGAR